MKLSIVRLPRKSSFSQCAVMFVQSLNCFFFLFVRMKIVTVVLEILNHFIFLCAKISEWKNEPNNFCLRSVAYQTSFEYPNQTNVCFCCYFWCFHFFFSRSNLLLLFVVVWCYLAETFLSSSELHADFFFFIPKKLVLLK